MSLESAVPAPVNQAWSSVTSLFKQFQSVANGEAAPSAAPRLSPARAATQQPAAAASPSAGGTRRRSGGVAVGPSRSRASASATACWTVHERLNLVLRVPEAGAEERCTERFADLAAAKDACEGAEHRAWCGGVTCDSGLSCGSPSRVLPCELRRSESDGEHPTANSWVMHPLPPPGATCGAGFKTHHNPRSGSRGGGGDWSRAATAFSRHRGGAGRAESAGARLFTPSLPLPAESADPLGALLRQKLQIAQARVARGPPAFERFPDLAFRYRDWDKATRHGRGDAYPLYTLDTLRNLADHLFDASTGYAIGPREAAKVRPCELVYSTLRPTSSFVRSVHQHITVPYLLMTDTADGAITHGDLVDRLLGAPNLAHWWAVDNEVLDHPKIESVPLGVMDALEIGTAGRPDSVDFGGSISAYLTHLLACQGQPKTGWLMMQMSETHPERRRVRATFRSGWGSGEVQLTPESSKRLRVREYLTELGRHRFVLSPRGNGLDAHRTWEKAEPHAVAHIPVRSARGATLTPLHCARAAGGRPSSSAPSPSCAPRRSTRSTRGCPSSSCASGLCRALHTRARRRPAPSACRARSARRPDPLRWRSCGSWADVQPALLLAFLANYTARKPLYRYEKLFADHWVGSMAVQRERCLAEQRAKTAARYVYDYNTAGGWAALDADGNKKPTPKWAPDAAKGG